MDMGRQLVIFPVKHNWREKAQFDLIHTSTHALLFYALAYPDAIWALPRPGCGNGGLDWSMVEPIVSVLPDNVHIYNWR